MCVHPRRRGERGGENERARDLFRAFGFDGGEEEEEDTYPLRRDRKRN